MKDKFLCSECGSIADEVPKGCTNCGDANYRRETRRRLTTAWLALFLGAFGAHKFYLRQYLRGLLALSCCWTMIPAFIALMEFFMYFFGTNEQFAKEHGHG